METDANYRDGNLTGSITLTLNVGEGLTGFCKEYINNYNEDRLRPFAVRLLLGKEMIITVYAVDKMHQYGDDVEQGKLPVKKFKLEGIPAEMLFKYFDAFNLTLTTGEYELEDMRVVNT